ncbi:MAG: CPBP family glutamic-type intramembrane protease [Bacteroidia bacterium]
MIKSIFQDTFRKAEEESARAMADGPLHGSKKVIVIGITAALVLTVIRYFGDAAYTVDVLRGWGLNGLAAKLSGLILGAEDRALAQLTWWVSVMIFCYLLVPMCIVRFVFREKLTAYGLGLGGALREWKLYGLMLVVMIPLVYHFSGTASFQSRYPFYQPEAGTALWPKFWGWELLYFGQFFALEFFFRGFMTLGLKERFGYYSIFVMTIPYCMIHFGKPLPETIGAIVAGIVLGTLSMKSRSVWLGVLIHYSVAITMDMCALWREGFFD